MERPFPFSEVRTIWMNGGQVPFENATVHVLSHALHYGSAVFEGLRCYQTRRGAAVFRLADHLDRLEKSCRIYRFELPYSRQELARAVLETLRANELAASYIRPLVYRGFRSIRMNPLDCPVEVAIAAWPTRGRFLGPEVEEKGVDVCVSSWRRPDPATLPVAAKAAGTYLSSQLITMEARINGYHEGIALDVHGRVSEGATDNVFLVCGGELVTPPMGASILAGITRRTVITLARDLGIAVNERDVLRGELYTADELFLTGTSVEVSPVATVDRIPVGDGKPGKVTRRLLAELTAICAGEADDRHGWLTPVYAEPATAGG